MREVSVVIPVHNRATLIERCLDSVLAQRRRPARLIVVDNNSTDDTLAVVREWMERNASSGIEMRLLTESKRGASAARNRGLREVETEYVYFFDSDDEMDPALLYEAMKNVGTADLIYWKAEYVRLDGSRVTKAFHADDLLRRQFYNGMLSTQCYMVRADLVREVGGWNEDASVWNDWELGLRIVMSEPRAVALDETLVTINAQEESITGRRYRDRAGEWENTLDIVESVVNERGGKDVKRLLDMTDYRRANLAALYRREGAEGYAATLLRKALERKRPFWRRWLLWLLWRYTVAGGRAAYYFWR